MNKYKIIFGLVSIEANSLAEAISNAKPEAVQAYLDDDSHPFGFAVAEAVAADLGNQESTVVEGAAAPIDFQIGKSYLSDSGKWTGRITSIDGGIYDIALRNRNGDTDEREFERTEAGNLRSISGNIVFRSVNVVR